LRYRMIEDVCLCVISRARVYGQVEQ